MSAKPTKARKLDLAKVKERDARQTALIERRVGAALNGLAAALASIRPNKKATVDSEK